MNKRFVLRSIGTEEIGDVIQAVYPWPPFPHGKCWVNISIAHNDKGESVAAEFAARVAETNIAIHGDRARPA